MSQYHEIAMQLSQLYSVSFGGKAKGRFRLSSKQLKEMFGRKRLYPEDIKQLTQAALEEGLVMIDMDSFYVVLSANAFVNYRRVSAAAMTAAMSA